MKYHHVPPPSSKRSGSKIHSHSKRRFLGLGLAGLDWLPTWARFLVFARRSLARFLRPLGLVPALASAAVPASAAGGGGGAALGKREVLVLESAMVSPLLASVSAPAGASVGVSSGPVSSEIGRASW